MQTLISGLSEQASRACIGSSLSQASAPIWQPASMFIAEAEMAAGNPACQWVWLYRAPWAWLAEGADSDPAAALQQWQVQQRAILQLRRYLGHKLILVNADRVAPHGLAARLGLTADAPVTLPAPAPLAMALAGLCEQLAPECWDIYETLEAAAWLPEGEPEFRSNRVLPGADALHALLDLMQAGNRLPAMQAALEEREQALQQLGEELQSTVARSEADRRQAIAELDERNRKIDELTARTRQMHSDRQAQIEENELLLSQLHQVQEELEKHYLENRALKEQVQGFQQGIAQLQSQQQKLQQERDAALQAGDQKEVSLQQRSAELAQLQKRLTEATQQLEQARVQQQKLQQERDAARKTAEQSEAACRQQHEQRSLLQQQLDKLKTELDSANQEGELLLNQLHQVQEELENYYLANRELLSFLGDSDNTLQRARRALVKLAAHV